MGSAIALGRGSYRLTGSGRWLHCTLLLLSAVRLTQARRAADSTQRGQPVTGGGSSIGVAGGGGVVAGAVVDVVIGGSWSWSSGMVVVVVPP